jgi:hypothetical protein
MSPTDRGLFVVAMLGKWTSANSLEFKMTKTLAGKHIILQVFWGTFYHLTTAPCLISRQRWRLISLGFIIGRV